VACAVVVCTQQQQQQQQQADDTCAFGGGSFMATRISLSLTQNPSQTALDLSEEPLDSSQRVSTPSSFLFLPMAAAADGTSLPPHMLQVMMMMMLMVMMMMMLMLMVMMMLTRMLLVNTRAMCRVHHFARHMSLFIGYTSHVTRHTPHVTRHTSQVTSSSSIVLQTEEQQGGGLGVSSVVVFGIDQ